MSTNGLTRASAAPPNGDRDTVLAAAIRHAIDLGLDRASQSAEAVTPAGFGNFDKELLRAARSRFIERLHERSDDFDATYGLRVLEAALRA